MRGLVVAVVLATVMLPATAVSAENDHGLALRTGSGLVGSASLAGARDLSLDDDVVLEPVPAQGGEGIAGMQVARDPAPGWWWPARGSTVARLPVPGLEQAASRSDLWAAPPGGAAVTDAPPAGFLAQLPQPAASRGEPSMASCAGADGRGYVADARHHGHPVTLRIWVVGEEVWTRVWHPGLDVDVIVSTNGDDEPAFYRSSDPGNVDRRYGEVAPGTVVHAELTVDGKPLGILFLCRVPERPADPPAGLLDLPDLGDIADALGLGLGYSTDPVPTAALPPCAPGLMAKGRGGARLFLGQHEGTTSWNVDLPRAQELGAVLRGRALQVTVQRGEPDARRMVDHVTSVLLGAWRTLPAELESGDRVGILVWGRAAPLFLPYKIAELECRVPSGAWDPFLPDRIRLGRLLGSGSYGNVYAVEGQPKLAIKLLQPYPESGIVGDRSLAEEVRMLDRLRAAGLRTAHHGLVSWTSPAGETRAGILMDRLEGIHSKQLLDTNHNLRPGADTRLVNQRTLSDLRGLMVTLERQRLVVRDLQFFVLTDGSVVVVDPLYVGMVPDHLGLSPTAREVARIIRVLTPVAAPPG